MAHVVTDYCEVELTELSLRTELAAAAEVLGLSVEEAVRAFSRKRLPDTPAGYDVALSIRLLKSEFGSAL